MIRYYTLEDGKIKPSKATDLSKIIWCDILQPTDNEMIEIAQKFNINMDDLEDCLEETERPRYNYDYVLKNTSLLLQIIYTIEIDIIHPPSVPIGLFLTPQGKLITIHDTMPKNYEMLMETLNRKQISDVYFLIIEILHFLVLQLDATTQKLATHIKAMQETIMKSLTVAGIRQPFLTNSYVIFFNTTILADLNAIKTFYTRNQPVFEKNLPLLEKFNDMQADLEQVYSFTSIIRDVLANSLDAYASVINLNLTQIMKVVGSITLILTIPMIIASYYGMNVGLPGGDDPESGNFNTFFLIIVISFALSFIIWWIFRKNKWL